MSGRQVLTAALRANTRRLALRQALTQSRSLSSSNFGHGGIVSRLLPYSARVLLPAENVSRIASSMFGVKRFMSSSDEKPEGKGEGQALSADEMESPSEPSVGNTTAAGAFKDLPMDDFESRVLGLSSKKDDGEDDDLLRELEEIERSASWRAAGPAAGDAGEDDSDMQEEDDDDDEDWEDERGQVLSDAALSAIVDYDLDDEQRPYQFRPDRLFFPGQTYDPEDLDLSKKPDELEKPPPRYRRKYDNNEVLQRADFRNPRYLSNFIAETSRILPKRRSSLTAKAQRKVIREIKTARTFGLMPFTSMGRAPFRFLRSRLDDEDSNN